MKKKTRTREGEISEAKRIYVVFSLLFIFFASPLLLSTLFLERGQVVHVILVTHYSRKEEKKIKKNRIENKGKEESRKKKKKGAQEKTRYEKSPQEVFLFFSLFAFSSVLFSSFISHIFLGCFCLIFSFFLTGLFITFPALILRKTLFPAPFLSLLLFSIFCLLLSFLLLSYFFSAFFSFFLSPSYFSVLSSLLFSLLLYSRLSFFLSFPFFFSCYFLLFCVSYQKEE